MREFMKNTLARLIFLVCTLAVTLSFPLPVLAEDAPKLTTVLTDKLLGQKADGEKLVYPKVTPIIYLTFESGSFKEKQELKVVWICVDSHGAAPANYKIDEAKLIVPTLEADKVYRGEFSLSKPDNGWPFGTVYVDNILNKTINFKID
jgi:hypothetical protein